MADFRATPPHHQPSETPKRSSNLGVIILGIIFGILILIASFLALTLNSDAEDSPQALVPRPTETASEVPSITPSVTATITLTPTATPSPTPTPIPPRVIHTTIKTEAWLETVRSEITLPNIYASGDRPGPLGRDSLRYNAILTITGGIDLDLFTVDNIQVDGTTITVTLPKPQIRDCILDETRSFYYERNCSVAGIGTGGCGELEDLLRQRALQGAAQADYADMLDTAFENAGNTVRELVMNIGGVESVIILKSADPLSTASLGGTCALHVN